MLFTWVAVFSNQEVMMMMMGQSSPFSLAPTTLQLFFDHLLWEGNSYFRVSGYT